MNKYLLPILFIGTYASAQHTSAVPEVKSHHNYLLTHQIEIDNTQGEETPTWDYEQVYDSANKRLIEIRNKSINTEGNAAIVMGTIEVSYPEQGVIITEEKARESGGGFVPVTKIKYQFNSDSTISTILQEEYNQDGNQYEAKYRYTFTYNKQGKVSSILWQEYLDEEDDNGTITKVVSDLFKDLYTYNEQGKLTQHLRVDNFDDAPLERRTYRYDAQGQPLGYIWEDMGEDGNYRKTFEQEIEMENGNAISITDYNYDESGVKKKNNLFVSTFDETISSDEVFSFRDVDSYIRFYEHHWYQNKNAKTDERDFSFDHHPIVNDWRQEKSFNHQYKKLETLGVYDIAKNTETIRLSPNPTTHSFSINTKDSHAKVDIYDTAGKLVASFAHKQDQYNISSLNSGVYMVVITSNNTKQSIKLIKQ